jgi:AAA domain-containing protein
MNIKLPQERIKAERVDPKKLILFSKPKVGKTEALSQLDNCLLLDLENGAGFVDAMKINVLDIARENEISPIAALKQVINTLKEANKAKGGFVYKYGAIDTVTALEDHCLVLANKLYKDTPQGRNWQGDDVTTLANGAGYQYTRKALWLVLEELEECFDTLIILAHVKDKLIEKEGKEMNERGLDLIGKSASILCSQVDAIGYIYREDNKTIANFQSSDSLICGSRSEHLKNQKITLIESDDKGNLTVDWTGIFTQK